MALTAGIGAIRAAARSWAPLTLLLGSAGACSLIGESKTADPIRPPPTAHWDVWQLAQ
ncbi:hypothetical protein [Paracoccus aminovorans]|uniref:hypothetical protein n=1 Tax=Paracoccus aminovorans TaxID=34004 RepID=UPI000AAE8C64|nr:hypothetical protein [Paracoccus aminovorans]